jgi:DNA polymerase V
MAFLSTTSDYKEEYVSLDKEFITHPGSTFFMRMDSNSMISAFIPPGALLVIDRSAKVQNMDIVVVTVNGELVVRYLKKNDFRAWLLPANSKLKDQPITPEMDLTVLGVVIAVVTEPHKLPVSVRPC